MERRYAMNKTYLITLTPTGKFFFGGDMTFEVKSKEKDPKSDPEKEKKEKEEEEKFNSKFSSYIIHSNKFPQQTSLLGMLRFLILRNNEDVFDVKEQKIKDEKKKEATELIGPESFKNSNTKNIFGKIEKLYPCFLQMKQGEEWRDLIRSPKDKGIDVGFEEVTPSVVNGKEVNLPMTNYNPKKEYKVTYKSQSSELTINEDNVFAEDTCNGINRDIVTGKVDDNAYFKQVFYRFNGDFRFAFYAEVDLDKLTGYNGQLVSVGGDNSQFIIGIEEAAAPGEPEVSGARVVLTSPAYLTKEDLTDVCFAISNTIPFKCMKTETKTVEAYNRRNHRYGYVEGLTLYDRGSVFYFKSNEEAQKFTEKLEGHADFHQIGYNHYK